MDMKISASVMYTYFRLSRWNRFACRKGMGNHNHKRKKKAERFITKKQTKVRDRSFQDTTLLCHSPANIQLASLFLQVNPPVHSFHSRFHFGANKIKIKLFQITMVGTYQQQVTIRSHPIIFITLANQTL